MSLTRTALKEKGVDKETIDFIMEAHGETIESTKEKLEAAAQKKIEALQAKVDSLPKQSSDGEDWKAKYDAEVIAHTTTKTTYETEKTTAAKSAKLEKLLTEKYGANPKYAAKMVKEFKLDDLKEDGDGFKDFDKLVEPVKTEWSDMFGTTTTTGAAVATPPAGVAIKADPTHKDMNAFIRGVVE